MFLAPQILCLVLVPWVQALLPLVNFTVTLEPHDQGFIYGTQAKSNKETLNFVCSDNNTLPSAAWGSYDGVTCSTTQVNQTFDIKYFGTWFSVEGNTDASGSIRFYNESSIFNTNPNIGQAVATPDDKKLYELARFDSDARGYQSVGGAVNGGRVTISRARFGTSLRSQAQDFSSTGRQTVFGVVNGSLNPAWLFSGQWVAKNQSESEIAGFSVVESKDSNDKVTIDVPANTSYIAVAGYQEPTLYTGLYITFSPPLARTMAYHYAPPTPRRPAMLLHDTLDPTAKYTLTLTTTALSINSVTFFSALSPIPDGYTAMGQDHIDNLNFLTGTHDGDTSGGPDSGGGRNSNSKSKTNLGAIIGGVVGGVVAVLLVAGVLWWCLRRRRAQRKQTFEPFEIDGRDVAPPAKDDDIEPQTSRVTPYLAHGHTAASNNQEPSAGIPAHAFGHAPAAWLQEKQQLHSSAAQSHAPVDSGYTDVHSQPREMRERDGGPLLLPPEYDSQWAKQQHPDLHRNNQYDCPPSPQPGPSHALLPDKHAYDSDEEDLK